MARVRTRNFTVFFVENMRKTQQFYSPLSFKFCDIFAKMFSSQLLWALDAGSAYSRCTVLMSTMNVLGYLFEKASILLNGLVVLGRAVVHNYKTSDICNIQKNISFSPNEH